MRILGLTGGIAAGKSVVARRLKEHGAVVVDADAIAREVVEPGTPGLDAIRRRFGEGVIAPDGTLDRAALGAIVFSDPAARADLNGITHPAVWRRSRELFGRSLGGSREAGTSVVATPAISPTSQQDQSTSS